MRKYLIILQAGIITVVAVFGAHSESGKSQSCPLPSAQSDQYCRK